MSAPRGDVWWHCPPPQPTVVNVTHRLNNMQKEAGLMIAANWSETSPQATGESRDQTSNKAAAAAAGRFERLRRHASRTGAPARGEIPPPSFPTAVSLKRRGFLKKKYPVDALRHRFAIVHVCVTSPRRDSIPFFLSFHSNHPHCLEVLLWVNTCGVSSPWHLLTFSQSLSSATFFFFFFVFAPHFCRQHEVKSSERLDWLRRSHKFLRSVFERGEKPFYLNLTTESRRVF